MGNSWNFKQIRFEIYNLFDITPEFSVLISWLYPSQASAIIFWIKGFLVGTFASRCRWFAVYMTLSPSIFLSWITTEEFSTKKHRRFSLWIVYIMYKVTIMSFIYVAPQILTVLIYLIINIYLNANIINYLIKNLVCYVCCQLSHY